MGNISINKDAYPITSEIAGELTELEDDNKHLKAVIRDLRETNGKLTEEVIRRQNEAAMRESLDALARAAVSEDTYDRDRADDMEYAAANFEQQAEGLTKALVLANDEVVHWKAVAKRTANARDAHYHTVVAKNERIRGLIVQLHSAEKELRNAHDDNETLNREITRLQRQVARVNDLEYELRKVREHDDQTTQTLLTERSKREDSVPRTLVLKWENSLRREATEAGQLGDYAKLAINRAIESVVGKIADRKEPPTK